MSKTKEQIEADIETLKATVNQLLAANRELASDYHSRTLETVTIPEDVQ